MPRSVLTLAALSVIAISACSSSVDGSPGNGNDGRDVAGDDDTSLPGSLLAPYT